ncbi:hypothetical protein [Corynebacterium mayonis]|uniref:hypothetical protein n=1 Tax=Corynebacterium mayonis TaxID=3062461 RepID=UPI0031403697
MTDKRLALTTLAVTVVGVLVHGLAAARGWLYWDDLILQSKARELGLGAALFTPHDGHLMPAAWVVEWLLATYAPLNWPAALSVLICLQALAAAAVAWSARQFAGRWAPLPVAIYLATPLTLPVSTWLAAGINTLPMHAALAMVLGHAARGKGGDTVKAAGWLIFGLMFNERALLITPLALMSLACWGYRDRIRPLATALAAPTIAWAAIYLALAPPYTSAEQRVSLLALLWRGYAEGLAPTAAGGPWLWQRWHPSPPFAHAPLPLIVLGALVVGVVLWWGRRHALVWLPALLYPVVPIVSLWWLRSGGDTAVEIVLTLRHLSEVAVLVALALAVLSPRLRIPPLAVAAFVASSLVSTVTFAASWSQQPARVYFSALRFPGLNQDVPAEVLLPVAHPHNRLDHLAPWLVTTSTTEPTLIDATGTRHPAALMPSRASFDACTDNGAAELLLDGPLYNLEWTVLLNYNASADGTAHISLDGEAVEVPVNKGVHQVWVRVAGGGARINVRSEVELCFGRSEVGQLLPSD